MGSETAPDEVGGTSASGPGVSPPGTECDMEWEQVALPVGFPVRFVIGEITVLNFGSGVKRVCFDFGMLTAPVGKLLAHEYDVLDANVGASGRVNPGGQIMTQFEGLPP